MKRYVANPIGYYTLVKVNKKRPLKIKGKIALKSFNELLNKGFSVVFK